MSDFPAFPQHGVLEFRTLEAVVFQWDGTEKQALIVTAELQRELPMRDAELTEARYVAQAGSAPGHRLFFSARRKADGQDWDIGLRPKQWAVLWLHEYRLHLLDVLTEYEGETLFRPQRPIVVLGQRRLT